MSLNLTTLAVAKKTDDIRMTLKEPACIVPRMFALVDAEWMFVTSNLFAPTVGVVPGYDGTPAGPHGVNAPVIFGIGLDFVNVGLVPFGIVASQSFGVPGPITGPFGVGVPVAANSISYLTAGGAFTLAAPGKDQQNTLMIGSTSAAAATVVFPTIGASGTVTNKTATFPASNAVLTLKAQGGGWVPMATAASGVTIA